MTSTARPIFSFLLLIFASISLASCGSRSLEDFREEGDEITHTLIKELSGIHARDQLMRATPKLKRLFGELVDVMIDAHKYRERHPAMEMPELSLHNHLVSEQLRAELNRIYQIEGARTLVEKYQEDAMLRLDAYEKQLKKKKAIDKL